MQEADDAALLGLQVEALFRCDTAGRLLVTNDPRSGPAPRFFLGRTPAGPFLRLRHDRPADLAATLARLAAAEPTAPGSPEPPTTRETNLRTLGEHSPIEQEWRGPAFHFPGDVRSVGSVVLVGEADATVLRDHFAGLVPVLPAIGPCAAVVEGGAAVAACWSARRSSRAAVAGVETAPAFRGRGYARAVVAGWAAAVRREGLLPLYSTSWDNVASRAVARSLGLVAYAEDWHIG